MHKSHKSTCSPKKPWVPPPGRTSKKQGSCNASKLEISHDEIPDPLTETQKSSHLPSIEMHDTFVIDDTSGESTFCIAPDLSSSKNGEAEGIPSTINSPLAENKTIENLFRTLQKLKEDLGAFRPVCISVRESVQLLHKPTFVPALDELTLNQMVIQTDQHLREFSESFDELENYISASERALKTDIVELANRLQAASACKEKTFIKCFEVYNSVTSTFKFLVEIIQQENLSSLFLNQESLANRLEVLQEEFLSREAKMQQLSKDFSSSQKKISSLQSQKNALEEKISFLNSELCRKEGQLQQWKLQSYANSYEIKSISENERLISIMEGLKQETESEKNALKKALKMQKLKADQYSLTIQQLQDKHNEREHEMFALAADRDQWKKWITNINFKLTEAENEKEHLKLKNLNLEKQIEALKEIESKSIGQITSITEERSKLLSSVTEENEKLNETVQSLQQLLSSSENEKKLLQKKCANLEAKLHTQENRTPEAKVDPEKGELHVLTPFLEELKESLSIIKERSHHSSNNTKHAEVRRNDSPEDTLVGLVKEIKNLIETKGVHYSSEDNIRKLEISAAESKQQELHQYDKEIAEKQKLLEKIEEKLSSTLAKSPVVEDYCLEPDLNQSGVNSSVPMKVKLLEEELKNKNLELVEVRQQKSDVQRQCDSQLQELKSDLSRVTANYESLQKYVTMLKSSYTNVFGLS